MHNVNTVTVNRKAVIHNTACACMWWDFFSGEMTCYATMRQSFYSCFTLVRATLHIGVCKWRQSSAADRPARSGRNKSMIFFRFLKQDLGLSRSRFITAVTVKTLKCVWDPEVGWNHSLVISPCKLCSVPLPLKAFQLAWAPLVECLFSFWA